MNPVVMLHTFVSNPKWDRLPPQVVMLPKWKDEHYLEYEDEKGPGASPLLELYDYFEIAEVALTAGEQLSITIVAGDIDPAIPRQVTAMAHRLWRWHKILRDLRVPKTLEALTEAVGHSWLLLLRALYLRHVIDDAIKEEDYDPRPMLLYETPRKFLYVHMLIECNVGSVVLKEGLRLYEMDMDEWLTTWLAYFRSRTTTGYTPSANEYQSALILQHAHVVLTKTKEEKERAQWALYFEPPLFHAMRHFASAHAFYSFKESTWFRRSVAWRQKATRALLAFVLELQSHLELRTMIIDRVRDALARRQLLPGEAEIAAIRRNEVNRSLNTYADADSVLELMRREVQQKLGSMLKMSAGDLFNTWVQGQVWEKSSEREGDDETYAWERAACRRSSAETTAFLVFEACWDSYMAYQKQGHFTLLELGHLDDGSLPAPHDAPPSGPEALVKDWRMRNKVLAAASKNYPPLFCRIAHLYATVLRGENGHEIMVWRTPHMVEALADWILRGVEQGALKRDKVPRALACLLEVDPL
jgi:hypothetical protein